MRLSFWSSLRVFQQRGREKTYIYAREQGFNRKFLFLVLESKAFKRNRTTRLGAHDPAKAEWSLNHCNHHMFINCPRTLVARAMSVTVALTALISLTYCTRKSTAPTSAIDLKLDVKSPFRFVTYGDTRFHDPKDTEAANPAVRVALVEAIADANPAFICFTGDVVYNGYDIGDWKVWDSETSIWRSKNIPVYPALGNHDLHGDQKLSLDNYFQRFPELKGSRYYSVRVANVLVLVLDSSIEEVTGPQGEWLAAKLDHVPPDLDFVFVVEHHPPYTSSSDAKQFGGGHSARPQEQALARGLEARQAHARFRIVVFSGHVHNYERHEHGGITYFVTGGGAAHAYPIERAPDDPFQSKDVNYHYLQVEVDRHQINVTMHRIELVTGKAVWTQPDSVTISSPRALASRARHDYAHEPRFHQSGSHSVIVASQRTAYTRPRSPQRGLSFAP